MLRSINSNQLAEDFSESPGGKYASGSLCLSEALGRQPNSTDLKLRHPFDVEICRVPAGKALCPYHEHSAQWEFYHVVSGTGLARHAGGTDPIAPGDAFVFGPGEPHQIINNGETDLVVYIVADNPVGESCHYPDSGKWLVRSPERRILRSENLGYFDGEE